MGRAALCCFVVVVVVARSAAADDTATPLRRFTATVDVAGPLYRWYDGEVTVRLARYVVAGLAMTAYGTGSSSMFEPSSYDVALTAAIFPLRAYEGPYLEGGLVALDRRSWDGGVVDIYKSGVRAVVGWQHTIDADEVGFTFAAAIGGETITNDSRNFPGRGLTGYVRVGIAL